MSTPEPSSAPQPQRGNSSAAASPDSLDGNAPHNFEHSLGELQQIVRDLEDGRFGLEESLQRFEQGIHLLRRCYEVLEQAEQKIEILTGVDAEGNPVTRPFDATSTIAQSEQSAGRRRQRRAAEPPQGTEESATEPDRGKRLF